MSLSFFFVKMGMALSLSKYSHPVGRLVSHALSRMRARTLPIRLELDRRQKAIDLQRPYIHSFVEKDEFVLVILDACRFDLFEQIYDEFLDGDLRKVWASGRWTADYTRRTWTEQYDLTYLTPMPVISDFYFNLNGMDYRPSEHIGRLVPLWESDWDPSLGTVPPEKVTDTALAHISQTDSTRIVVHYSQPHAPYIGNTEILPWEDELDDIRELLEKDIDRPNQRIYKRIKNGEISRSYLKTAYVDNLKRALEEVVRLVRRIECTVVITGDHGEHLGENDKYLHEEDSTLIRQVPWFVVDKHETGHAPIESRYADREIGISSQKQQSEEIKERLADLGYIDTE